MEEWDFVDDRELQGWKGACICMTCQHFCYGVDQHYHTLLGVQRQTEAAPAGRPPQKEMPAMGTDLAEGVWLGSGSGLKGVPFQYFHK